MSRLAEDRKAPRPAGAGPPRPAQSKGRTAPALPAENASALPLVLALIATVAVHYAALGTYFAQDDVTFIARARGIAPTPWSFARPLSEALTWRALVALFGLDPFPYHAFNFGLHLANVALVYAIGVRLLGGRPAAGAAAALFGTSGIAFTPLNWISGLVELTVTTASLGAFLLYLRGREAARGGRPAGLLLWASAALVLAALLSKENAILLPLAFALAHLRLDAPVARNRQDARPRADWKPLVPSFAAAAFYAVAFLATLRTVHYLHSEAYARSFGPGHLIANASTYLKWLITPYVPIRDAYAGADPGAKMAGAVVALIIACVLWAQRRAPRHPEEVGAAWFLVLLAPVVPLANHTYLYYLYLPLPGLCWMAAAAGARLLDGSRLRRSGAAPWVAVAAVIVLVLVDLGAVRARRNATSGVLPLDRTMSESLLLKNAIADLRASGLAPGDTIALVNPAPVRHERVGVGVDDPQAQIVTTYFPLEGAMRGGEAIRVFFPGSGYLGLGRNLPAEWERAKAYLFFDEGKLQPLGSGTQSLVALGEFAVKIKEWAKAESLFTRSLALGDTLPGAEFGLIATAYYQGRRVQALERAGDFLHRWPNDWRSPKLARQFHAESLAIAQGR